MKDGGFMKKKIMFIFIFVFTLLGLVSCGKTKTTSTSYNQVIYGNKNVSVATPSRKYLKVGETYQLLAHSYGTLHDKVNFTSNNPDMVSVSETGLVKALNGNGPATITIEASDDSRIRTNVTFTIVNDFKLELLGLSDIIDSFNEIDKKEGLSFSGEIEINLGEINAQIGSNILETSTYLPIYNDSIKLEYNVSYYSFNDENMIKVSLPLSKTIDKLFSSGIVGALKSTLKPQIVRNIVSIFNPNFDTYLSDLDYNDLYSLDIYNFKSFDIDYALTRNFGTENEPNIKPFAYEEDSLVNLASNLFKKGSKLISGTNLFKSKDNSNKVIDTISSLFTTDNLLSIQNVLSRNIIQKREEDVVSIKTSSLLIMALNGFYSSNVKDNNMTFNLNGININFKLPKSISDISFKINYSDNKFEKTSFSVIGKNDLSEEYDFIKISLDSPKIIGKEKIKNEYNSVFNYKKARQQFIVSDNNGLYNTHKDVKDVNKECIEVYNVIKDGAKYQNSDNIDKKITDWLNYYYDVHYMSNERQDLLYPMYRRLNEIGYGKDLVSVVKPLGGINDSNNYLSFNHYKDYKRVEDYTVSYESSDNAIISVDSKGVLTCKKIYNGNIINENTRSADYMAQVRIKVEALEGSTGVIENGINENYTLYYTGSNYGFRETTHTLNSNINLDLNEHILYLKENSEFDLNQLFTLSNGETINYIVNDSKLAEINNTTLKTKSKYLLSDNKTYRNICTVIATISGDKEEKVIVYVVLE